jgi:Ca2+-binding EF-hand superfamily protein
MKKTPIARLAAAALLTATAVIASPDGPSRHQKRGEHHFIQMDSNADGAVSKQEYLARRAAKFKEADANGDGKLTQGELEAAIIKRITDKDGAISEDEMTARAEHRFEKKDHDHDHQITPGEMRHRGHRGEHHKGGHHGDKS